LGGEKDDQGKIAEVAAKEGRIEISNGQPRDGPKTSIRKILQGEGLSHCSNMEKGVGGGIEGGERG